MINYVSIDIPRNRLKKIGRKIVLEQIEDYNNLSKYQIINKYLYLTSITSISNETILKYGLTKAELCSSKVESIYDKIKDLNFGDITFEALEKSVEESEESFLFTSTLHKYNFISNWVALNQNTSKQYSAKNGEDRLQYLNNLVAKNIVFISREIGFDLPENIYYKINVSSLKPIKLDQNGWGAFEGEFFTNLILPNYIGIGNGITRGYGTITAEEIKGRPDFTKEEFDELKSKSNDSKFCLDKDNLTSSLLEVDISAVQRPNLRRNKNKKKKQHLSKKKKRANTKSSVNHSKNEYKSKDKSDEPINYNSYEYHKKQHSIR